MIQALADAAVVAATSSPHDAILQLETQLIGAIVTLLGAALTAFVAMGIRWITSHTANVKAKALLGQLDDFAYTAVKEAQQTVIKNAPVITDTVNQQAKRVAVGAVNSHFGEQGIAALKKAFKWTDAAVQQNISSAIESQIHAVVDVDRPDPPLPVTMVPPVPPGSVVVTPRKVGP